MSLTVWQKKRATALKAKGFPPVETALIVGAQESEMRRAWPRLTVRDIGKGLGLVSLPKPPAPKTPPKPPLKEPVIHCGVIIQPRQVLPKFPARAREILKQVAAKHEMRLDVLFAQRRYKVLVVARQEAMYRIWKELGYSFPLVGRLFGVDHSTVMHATGRHLDRIKKGAI